MKYFLIVGNTRVGSTWLETSLDLLPDIICRREIRWKMPYAAWARVHSYVDATTTSMKERIESTCRQQRDAAPNGYVAVGSKLKFDPYGFSDPAGFTSLKTILESDIAILLLRRSYVEMFSTWKVFGLRHHLTERSSLIERADAMMMVDIVRQEGNPAKSICLVKEGQHCGQMHRELPPEQRLDYPIEDAVDDMFVFFYNDLQALMLTDRSTTRLAIDYSEIAEKFFEVTAILGSHASQRELSQIISEPVTRKLAGEDQIVVDPSAPLAAVSACLDQAYEQCRLQNLRPEDLMRYDARVGNIQFRVPDLDDVFKRFECFTHLQPHTPPDEWTMRRIWRRNRVDTWTSRRPIYVPEASALSPSLRPETQRH